MTNNKDCQRILNNEVSPADETLALELLADLDIGESAPVANFIATTPALRAVAAKQKERTVGKSAKQSKPSSKPSAIKERERYAQHKGGDVRTYSWNNIEPRRMFPYESEEDYQRRYKREYAQITRGVTAEDIEANALNRELTTQEERKQDKAKAEAERRANIPTSEQSAARKARRHRAKERANEEATATLAARSIV
jgi:hypothetical protein